ncbi:unnamed protein product [Psylliodes chrysocephalus]|uniref:Uncharacterized protein n=1 Tax=Psylliodes chrysocephalus TaxID=3402493 RepID=A0A9P0CVY7_9CUCU|nr:unnamed protein product [Psylliodes chrysocephala]
MTRRCDSNPAQYERNRRFGHLVDALTRAGNGAKLPSVGLCLNASKAVSFLVKGGNDISWSSESRKAQNNVTLLGNRSLLRLSHEPYFSVEINGRRWDRSLPCPTRSLDGRTWVIQSFRCWNSELSVDDLRTWQGVVPGRAVSTLRSIETQPLAWGFVLSIRRDPCMYLCLYTYI